MKVSPLVMMASALAVLLPGCVTPGEQAARPEPRPPAPRSESPGEIQFHTRADTVTALRGVEQGPVGAPGRSAEIRFMVQIGAFKDPHLASRLQAEARRQYHLPVLNDYHAGTGLYQIRIGMFETRESALEFLRQLRRDHPGEYADAWIVHLKR